MKSLLFFFAFITIFQAIGMVMLGTTLRSIILALREHGWAGVRQVNAWWIRLIIGGGLALFTTLAGYSELVIPLLRILYVVIGVAAFIVSLIGIRQRLFVDLQASEIIMIIVGAIFFIIGMAASGELLRQRELFPTLIFVLLLCGLGAVALIMGFRRLISGE